jgi:hypothetical protein
MADEPVEAPPADNADVKSNKSKQPTEKDALLANDNDKTRDDSLHRVVAEGEMCCCCICHCSRPETVHLSCFGCFPIKCGIVAIGILTLFLILSSYVEIFYMLLNDGIHWWYVLVSLVLLIPLLIAASFLTAFFNTDNGFRRGTLRVACIFVIISYTLLAIWNICYFQFWYKHPNVIMGQGAFEFTQTKKQYVFWSVATSITIVGFYAYFICVVARYKNALRHEAEKEEAAEKALLGEAPKTA